MQSFFLPLESLASKDIYIYIEFNIHKVDQFQQQIITFAPAARMNDAIEAAIPTLIVITSDLMCCMVSNMARPAITEPPGQFTYR